MGKPVMRAMPFTKEALKAAELWMKESCMWEMVDPEDEAAVTDGLAEAFATFAREEIGRLAKKKK